MVLATHAIAGAAVAQLFPDNPALGFGLALVSHFVLDMIPHWDYHLSSLELPADGNKLNRRFHFNNPTFIADLMKIGADGLLGLLAAFIFFYPQTSWSLWLLVLGVFGGVLPDWLQFVFYKYRPRWLQPLQRFHIWIHARRDFNDRPIAGVLMQMALAVLIVFVLK